MVNHAESNKVSSLPSIGLLFRESWQTLTQSMLSLFILDVLALVVVFGLAIVAILVFILSGAGSFLLKNGLQNIVANLPAIIGPMLGILAVVAVVFIVISLIVGSALQVASILLVDSKGKISLGDALKKSLRLVVPLFLVNILTSVLMLGAFFVFIVPVILFYFLLIFTQFEVVLENQRWLSAIKRSVAIVSKNFGAILIRLIIITLIYITIVAVIPDLLEKIGPGTAIFVGMTSFIVNLILGWFILAYQITLYKQAKASVGAERGKGITWMWIIAIIGWLVAVGIFFVSYKAVSSGILNEVFKKSSSIAPGNLIQRSADQMKPEAAVFYNKSQELFEQMREVSKDSSKTEAQIVAEIKKLNDENIAQLKKALEIQPNNPRIWYELGNAYTWVSSTGKPEDSLAAYRKAEELDPNNVVYINGVGDMLLQMGKYEEAVLQFQKTLRLTDKSGYANLSIARAYSRLKIYDSAREHYNKAITIFTSENKDGSFDTYLLQAKKELAGLPK